MTMQLANGAKEARAGSEMGPIQNSTTICVIRKSWITARAEKEATPKAFSSHSALIEMGSIGFFIHVGALAIGTLRLAVDNTA
jgi:hypothetical protein